MTVSQAFRIRPADWSRDEASIAQLRREVFIDEQHVPEELEWGVIDTACSWFIAESDDGIVGVVRLLPDGHVGRMAVRYTWRRKGVGSALLAAALQAARESGLWRVILSAQLHAVPFYTRAGFQAQGPTYLDAGIPHQAMHRDLR